MSLVSLLKYLMFAAFFSGLNHRFTVPLQHPLARLSVLALLLSACASQQETGKVITPPAVTTHTETPASPNNVVQPMLPLSQQAPALPREFRAIWVSTFANIDWPSRRELSADKQKAEALAILDMAQQMKLNAIVLQVRPAADAMYASNLEPWSEFLTGEQGRAPVPFYDPLQFWIQEAHARGLELHAWFNPYRARSANAKSFIAANHVSRTLPGVVKTYGELLWMDPGEPSAAAQTLRVINDVLKRYDVDGIHIDDYFYPYPVKNSSGQEIDFPDEPSWRAYQQQGGKLTRADWRRDNVNRLVQAIYSGIRQEKPWVKFGISPFGIGRPDRLPAGIAGFSQYDRLYADVELWLQQGWLDYLAPQLYWPINQTAQAFNVLHDYWRRQNPQQRHIWPGLFTSKIDASEKSWPADEILNQVEAMRASGGNGHIHFSTIPLLQNRREVRRLLSQDKYLSQALVPESPWMEAAPINPPQWEISADRKSLRITQLDQRSRLLAVWRRTERQWLFSVQPVSNKSIDLSDDAIWGPIHQVTISAISRTGQESPRTAILLQQKPQ